MTRLVQLYRKGRLTDEELEEYSQLRKGEYLQRKDELTQLGKVNIRAVKGEDDDIIGWISEDTIVEPV